MVGPFRRGGQVYCDRSPRCKDHDFPSFASGKIIPYGIYDVQKNTGYMSFGISHDTAEFSCDNFKYYWNCVLQNIYPHATTIMLLCDGGGSNRLFKQELIKLSKDIHIDIIVTHYPPYTSKWNPIEHRLFSQITRVWSGISFESVEQARELAAETRTKSGLCVFTNINRKKYDTSRCVDSNYDDVCQRHITFDKELPKWNYKVSWRDKNTKLIFKCYLNEMIMILTKITFNSLSVLWRRGSISLSVMLTSVLMCSCSDEHLAKLLDANWIGEYTEAFGNGGKNEVSLYRQFSYIPNQQKYDGEFSEALYVRHSPMELDGATISFKDRVYITGTWEIVNGDLYLTYKPATLQVKVLPQEGKLEYSNLADALEGLSSDLESMSSTKDELLKGLQDQLYGYYRDEYVSGADMEDGSTSCDGLKISDGVMHYLDNAGDSVTMTITNTTPEEIIEGKGASQTSSNTENSSSTEETQPSAGGIVEAYKKVVKTLNEKNVYQDIAGAHYFLYDISGDDVPELWVTAGNSEATTMLYVYTYQNGLKKLYEGGASEMAFFESDEHIIGMYAHMGEAFWTRYEMSNGRIIGKQIYHQTLNGSEEDYKYPAESPIDMTDGTNLQPIENAVG